MSKAPEVRLSKWSAPRLSEAQQEYAALDAILSLDVYVALEKLPDLAAKLTAEQAVAGTKADVVPVRGSVGVLAPSPSAAPRASGAAPRAARPRSSS